MMLRHALLYNDLARGFCISVALVGSIFQETIRMLATLMHQIIVWLPRETIHAALPQSFRDSSYSKTTCIIDCTEVYFQRPKNLYARAQTYSNYEGNNTVKFLVVVAPNGYIMFVSNVYGGCSQDKLIFEK